MVYYEFDDLFSLQLDLFIAKYEKIRDDCKSLARSVFVNESHKVAKQESELYVKFYSALLEHLYAIKNSNFLTLEKYNEINWFVTKMQNDTLMKLMSDGFRVVSKSPADRLKTPPQSPLRIASPSMHPEGGPSLCALVFSPSPTRRTPSPEDTPSAMPKRRLSPVA